MRWFIVYNCAKKPKCLTQPRVILRNAWTNPDSFCVDIRYSNCIMTLATCEIFQTDSLNYVTILYKVKIH